MPDWIMTLESFLLTSLMIITIAYIENKRTANNSILFFIFEAIIAVVFGYLMVQYFKNDISKNWINIIGTIAPTILSVIVFYVVNSVKNFKLIQEQIIQNKELLEEINKTKNELITFSLEMKNNIHKLSNNIEDIEQNIKNLKYSENWHNKIKTSVANKTIWKHIATKYFEIQRGYLENENKVITSLDYYPSITKQLFEKYKKQKTAKFEIISTMLPQHYFNFPIKKICDGKTKRIIQQCKKVDFVNTYRKDISELVRKIKNSNNNMIFNRYTLLLDSNDETGFNGLFSVTEFDKSKKVFLERDINKIDDFVDDNNIYRENSEQKNTTDITPYDYFMNELHSEKAKIKLLKQDEIDERLGNFNFLRIEHKINRETSIIYIVAEISISKNLVSLEIIDNSNFKRFKELEEDYNYIQTRKNYQ